MLEMSGIGKESGLLLMCEIYHLMLPTKILYTPALSRYFKHITFLLVYFLLALLLALTSLPYYCIS